MTPKLQMLVVDDRWERIQRAYLEYSEDFDIVFAGNVKEALRLMSSRDFDAITLDHDLNGCDFEDPDSPTCGMEIVRYLTKTGWPPQKKKPMFYVHSSNLFAAHLMVTSIKNIPGCDAKYVPLPKVAEHMKYDTNGIPL